MKSESDKIKHAETDPKVVESVESSEIEQSNEVIECKEAFYGDSFNGYIKLVLLFSFVVVIFLYLNFYIIKIQPTEKYFFVDNEDRIISAYPLQERVYSDAEIMDWTAQAVIKLFDFNFLNLSNQIRSTQNLFIGGGFDIAVEVLKTRFIPKIFSKRYIVKASLCDVAEIISSELVEDQNGKRYVWKVLLPTYFMFARDSNQGLENQVARLIVTVERVSDLNYLDGVAIRTLEIEELTLIERQKNYSALPVCQDG